MQRRLSAWVSRALVWCALVTLSVSGIGGAAFAQSAPASLPRATQKILKDLNLQPSLMSGLDRELNVPQAWIDGARKEGHLRILSTWDPPQVATIFGPFKERYPFVDISYSRASDEDRTVKTILAYREGRIVTDIVTGLGGHFFLFREAGALESLKDIPNLKNNVPNTQDPGGLWVGMDLRYWCMAYNTNLVKKSDLPRKWEDLLTNPVWRNKNLALANRPQLFGLQLWKKKGKKWMEDYLTRLFTEVKPQLRKEGTNAVLNLTAAGEFYADIPAASYRVKQMALEGAPVGFTCPEPVPTSNSEMAIMKHSPNVYAAKLFVNWFLSKEGQIAQYAANYDPPVHKGLQLKELVPFADQILGREQAFRMPGDELKIQPELLKFWSQLWLEGGGKLRRK